MSDYPHRCPACGKPAYVGFRDVECSAVGCKHCARKASEIAFAPVRYVRIQYVNGQWQRVRP